jgi:ABC-type transport system involved in multi-copper enzyme maturation permease subunit
MSMLIRQLRSEWMRGRGRPVEKYTGAVVIVLGVLIPIVMILMTTNNPVMRKSALDGMAFPMNVRSATTMVWLLGPFLAAALGANIVGAEYQYGTWPWLLVRGSSRLRLVLVKILTVSARIVTLTFIGVVIFAVMGAVVCAALGARVVGDFTTAGQLLIPFVGVGGAMAFAAAIGLTVTVVSRSVAFGTLMGALAFPLFTAIRFKETASWIPYVHLENLQSRLLSGYPSPFLKQVYAFEMSARASTGVIALELLVVLAVAYAVFRRQEIVY